MQKRWLGGAIVCVMTALLSGCAQKVATPTVSTVDQSATDTAVQGHTAVTPAAYPDGTDIIPLPEGRQALFRAGDTNALEIPVDEGLAEAYEAFFIGDGPRALAALDRSSTDTAIQAFHVSAQRVRTLIMMGRAAEAESMSNETAVLERAALGTDVNALALRAEARLWLADYDAAEADALQVASALQSWVLPSSYGGPPTNMAEIVLLTTAQLRAYTVLAGLYTLQGEGEAALPWAEAAERGFNTVHGVAADSLYGMFLKPYPESYYGRAFNLLFRASAKAIAAGNFNDGAGDFTAARAYFDAIGYQAGSVSAAALESWTLYDLDQDRDRALAVSEEAVQMATEAGFPDFIWRISTLRGEMLIDEGRMQEAEAAFRRADASVDLVTGALATDRAKLRYGVGKETISYRLAQFNLAAGDLNQLFQDMERSRARAFVDMLADRPVASGRHAALVQEIKELDDQIRQARLAQLAPRPVAGGGDAGLAVLLDARRALVDRLREVDPDLADVHAAETADLEMVRALLGPDDALAYAIPARGEDKVSLLIADRSGTRIVETTIDADGLNRLIIRFRESVRLQRDGQQASLAEQMQQVLSFDEWRPDGRLYVVPAGDLFFVPWGALPDVVETVVLPTGGWLLRETDGINSERVGLVGDPEFGGVMPQLSGAREEVQSLGQLFGTTPLIAGQATRAAVWDQVGEGASLLHIASHGTFDATTPLNSAIVLSDGNMADPISAGDLFANPLPVDMVVLSACETGMGEAVAGDDFLGLARSFYLGGARTVMNSLWPIADVGTKRFMEVFHAEALRVGDAATAWLVARNTLRDEGFPPSVYGAFVLGGAG